MEVEGHGREEIREGVEVTRTVGWFTAVYKVRIRVGEEGEGLRRRIEEGEGGDEEGARGGIGYGLLRYKGGEETERKLKERGGAEISFNYLGQLDQVLDHSSPFGSAKEIYRPGS